MIDAALEGARSRGAEVKKAFLVDYEITQFKGSGGADEALRCCPEELGRLCEEADAIALGAPVYWGDVNGLTKDFMDTVRISNANGKPALGIAIAGGTGLGLLSGVQTIYHFFLHRQMRGIDPTPVSRFNFQEAMGQLRASGAKLADLAKGWTPFRGQTREERWPEILAHYASLKYLGCDPLDEFVMLAEQMIRAAEGDRAKGAKAELDRALHLMAKGNRAEATRYAVSAYLALYAPP